MREIKFRVWDKGLKQLFSWEAVLNIDHTLLNFFAEDDYILMQYTGLKDKNGLTCVYEGDIIGVGGLARGNIYENGNLLQDKTNLVIEGFGTKAWLTTYKKAMARGCKDSE